MQCFKKFNKYGLGGLLCLKVKLGRSIYSLHHIKYNLEDCYPTKICIKFNFLVMYV